MERTAPVKRKAPVADPKPSAALGVSVGLRNPAKGSAGQSLDLGSLVIVMGLALAIACFSVAMIPATAVRWRPAATFVSERHLDLTVVGLVLLTLAAFTLFLSGGP